MEPRDDVIRLARAMLEDMWNHRLAASENRTEALQTELAKLGKQVDQFLDRLGGASVPSVISAYEEPIRKLEECKLALAEKIDGASSRNRTCI